MSRRPASMWPRPRAVESTKAASLLGGRRRLMWPRPRAVNPVWLVSSPKTLQCGHGARPWNLHCRLISADSSASMWPRPRAWNQDRGANDLSVFASMWPRPRGLESDHLKRRLQGLPASMWPRRAAVESVNSSASLTDHVASMWPRPAAVDRSERRPTAGTLSFNVATAARRGIALAPQSGLKLKSLQCGHGRAAVNHGCASADKGRPASMWHGRAAVNRGLAPACGGKFASIGHGRAPWNPFCQRFRATS